MRVWQVENMRDGLIDVCRTIVREGIAVSPRGQETLELAPAMLVLEHPADVVANGIERASFQPAIGVAEGLQLVAGESRPKLLAMIAPVFERFMEDDGTLHGAYGPRIYEHTRRVVRLLAQEPDSRQAVIDIYDAERDLVPFSSGRPRDVPCTLTLHFTIRTGKLNLHVDMRSNDAWLGLPYDVMQFATLQLSMARALRVPAGTYFHHAHSLHLYTSDLKKVTQLKRITTYEAHRKARHRWHLHGVGRQEHSWEEIQHRARELLNGVRPKNATDSETRYHEILERFV